MKERGVDCTDKAGPPIVKPNAQTATSDGVPKSQEWICAKCGQPMQFRDGMCWECFGGDPGA